MIQLQTSRLNLRDYTSDDLDSYFTLFSDKKVTYYFPEGYIETIEEAKKELDITLNEIGKGDRQRYFFCIRNRENDSYIGEIGYSIIQNTPIGKLIGMGWFILPKYWSNGYATEAFQEVIRFAFEEDNVYRIKAGCIKENIHSEKVMIKCGMIKEADFKNCAWHDGQIKDSVT